MINLTKNLLKSVGVKFEAFFKRHCKEAHYHFSVKKCGERTRLYLWYSTIELISYSYGASLPDVVEFSCADETIVSKLYTSAKLTCNSPMEIPYYGVFLNEPLFSLRSRGKISFRELQRRISSLRKM